jgi:hypothetical protein
MRRPVHHAKPTMTRAQNRTAFTMWLNGCSDEALGRANSISLGRSYGLEPNFVAAEVVRETGKRRISQAILHGRNDNGR